MRLNEQTEKVLFFVFVFFVSFFFFFSFFSQSEHVQKGSQKMYLAFLKAQIAKRNCKLNRLARTYPVYLQTHTDRSFKQVAFADLDASVWTQSAPLLTPSAFLFWPKFLQKQSSTNSVPSVASPPESIDNLSINHYSIRSCYNQMKGNPFYNGGRRLANQRAPAFLIV